MAESIPEFDPTKLVAFRKERGLSQRGLGAAAGVSQALVAELERGKHPPSRPALEKIASALGTDIGALLLNR